MPTYSYACKDCGHAFDIQQAFSDNALTRCPECEGSLRKIFSAVGVVFKGSGFYRTDSRSSGSSSTSSTSSSTKSSTSGSEGSGSGSSNSSSEKATPAPSTSSASTTASSTAAS